MKIIEYQIAVSTSSKPLTYIVNLLIKDGWQPYGDPYVVSNGIERQAMVKYEQADNINLGQLAPLKDGEFTPGIQPGKLTKKTAKKVSK